MVWGNKYLPQYLRINFEIDFFFFLPRTCCQCLMVLASPYSNYSNMRMSLKSRQRWDSLWIQSAWPKLHWRSFWYWKLPVSSTGRKNSAKAPHYPPPPHTQTLIFLPPLFSISSADHWAFQAIRELESDRGARWSWSCSREKAGRCFPPEINQEAEKNICVKAAIPMLWKLTPSI